MNQYECNPEGILLNVNSARKHNNQASTSYTLYVVCIPSNFLSTQSFHSIESLDRIWLINNKTFSKNTSDDLGQISVSKKNLLVCFFYDFKTIFLYTDSKWVIMILWMHLLWKNVGKGLMVKAQKTIIWTLNESSTRSVRLDY